jgi:hypothetical protein
MPKINNNKAPIQLNIWTWYLNNYQNNNLTHYILANSAFFDFTL